MQNKTVYFQRIFFLVSLRDISTKVFYKGSKLDKIYIFTSFFAHTFYCNNWYHLVDWAIYRARLRVADRRMTRRRGVVWLAAVIADEVKIVVADQLSKPSCELSWWGLRGTRGAVPLTMPPGNRAPPQQYTALLMHAGLCVGGPYIFPSCSWDSNWRNLILIKKLIWKRR